MSPVCVHGKCLWVYNCPNMCQHEEARKFVKEVFRYLLCQFPLYYHKKGLFGSLNVTSFHKLREWQYLEVRLCWSRYDFVGGHVLL